MSAIQSASMSNDSLDDCNPQPEGMESQDDLQSTLEFEQRKITVKFGTNEAQFSASTLKQLPYFDSFLSERWKSTSSNDCIEINVFGNVSNSNANNSHNSTKTSHNNDNNMNNNVSNSCLQRFERSHLQMLLNFLANNEIVTNESEGPLEFRDLDALLFCSDFFGAGSDACTISEYDVIKYIQNRLPAVTPQDRQQWIEECRHPRLKKALIKLDEKTKQQLSLLQSRVMGIGAHLRHQHLTTLLSSIGFDSDTAALIFMQTFELRYSWCSNNLNLTIHISNFNESEWDQLIGSFDMTNYWHYFGPVVTRLIQNINKCSIAHGSKLILPHASFVRMYRILKQCLDRVIEHDEEKNIKVTDDCQMPYNMDLYSLMRALLVLTIGAKASFPVIGRSYYNASAQMQTQDRHRFALFLLSVTKPYAKIVDRCKDINNRKREWYRWLMSVTQLCTASFLVQNAADWFEILHSTDAIEVMGKSCIVKFVCDDVLPKLSMQNGFDFALFLVDWVVIKDEQQLCTEYADFIKKAGINWDILPTKN